MSALNGTHFKQQNKVHTIKHCWWYAWCHNNVINLICLQITIEIDSDLCCALRTFVEMSVDGRPLEHRSLHAQECTEVILERDDHSEPLEPYTIPTTTPSRRKRGISGSSGTKKVCNTLFCNNCSNVI